MHLHIGRHLARVSPYGIKDADESSHSSNVVPQPWPKSGPSGQHRFAKSDESIRFRPVQPKRLACICAEKARQKLLALCVVSSSSRFSSVPTLQLAFDPVDHQLEYGLHGARNVVHVCMDTVPNKVHAESLDEAQRQNMQPVQTKVRHGQASGRTEQRIPMPCRCFCTTAPKGCEKRCSLSLEVSYVPEATGGLKPVSAAQPQIFKVPERGSAARAAFVFVVDEHV